ncbi:hypothetical protein LTR04_004895 [Oleoguttula sp. CCFEE 6159]|nr:hypothetical protein LTR04_004895 [Oleoguttula sp. CCFEE 6159]
MYILSLYAIGALVASFIASPAPGISHVVHEKRNELPHGWTRRSEPSHRAVLPMRIALKQRNIDRGHEYLDEVSHPASAKYGQHWTAKEVAETFAPSDDTINAVKEWLTSAGIAGERIKLAKSLNWLQFDASVEEAESLLKTKYHIYDHVASGQPHVACNQYSLPKHIREHVDFITPTVHFDAKLKAREETWLSKRRDNPSTGRGIGKPWDRGHGSYPKWGHWIDRNELINDLRNCSNQITPACLRALYQLPPGRSANPKNSYGIVEYTPQAYVPSDLDLFFANFSQTQVGDRPILDSIDGGVIQQVNMSFAYNGESDLDLEYAITLVYPQKVTLYQVGDIVEGASFNNFLDAIDGTYCTYEGGDDPTQDGTYPDPKGGYQGPENCGGYTTTKVISTSYSYNEADLTALYEERQCSEYMKLGMMGVSVLYSSGDYGVAGNLGQCLDRAPNGTLVLNNGTDGYFNPSFPGSCPYITSVGATQVKNNIDITKALATGTQSEMACETIIYSGGGFSNVFPLPNYQASAVKGWFANYPPPYGSDRFNNSQQTRGFPDISANGANYAIAIDGKWALVYGTSASSPTTGSILTLINEARFNAGKGSISFINPVLYANPDVLNDITEGGNQGCGTPGFGAAPGWDPVTGLGTPNYPKMLKLFSSLP